MASVASVSLVPVIEISGFVVAPEVKPPDTWTAASRREWRQRCHAAAGLALPEPLIAEQFDVGTIEQPQLRRFVDLWFAHHDYDAVQGDLAEALAFDGGYALCLEGRPVLRARCCGDLGNLLDWRKAVGLRDGQETAVWIGHPQLRAKRAGEVIELRDDPSSGELGPQPFSAGVDLGELRRAVENAEAAVEAFGSRLTEVLGGARAAALSSALIGLREPAA